MDSGLVTLQAQQRVLARGLFSYVLDEVGRLARRHDGDLVKGVVAMAITQATRGPAAGEGEDPAAATRAVSVRAIGQSLGLAYETTRRKVVELEAAGLCRRVSALGVSASPVVRDQAFLDGCEDTWRSLRRVIATLGALGFDFGLVDGMSAQSAPARAATLAEAVAALNDAFILRVFEAGVAPHGSITDSAIITAMLIANSEPVATNPQIAWKYAGATTPPPDSLRRPATITEIADRIGMTRETVRRRVNRYIEIGWASRVTGGYLFSMERQQSPEVLQTGLASAQRFLQLLQALRVLGVELETVQAD